MEDRALDLLVLRVMVAPRQFLWLMVAASALLAALAAGAVVSPALLAEVERAARTVTADDLSAHLRVLASDDMEGRGLESSGNDRAAEYIAEALRRSSVPAAYLDLHDPRSSAAYFQNFALFDAELKQTAALELRDPAGARLASVSAGADFYPSPLSAAATVTAPATFDEKAPPSGRILFLSVTEAYSPCASRTLRDRIAAARVRGVAGIVATVALLEPVDQVWRIAGSDTGPKYQTAEIVDIPVVCIAQPAADRLRPLVAGAELTIAADIARRPVPMRNVVAAIPGADPARRGELVVVGAHLDHDGVDARRGVMNGADDDASGVSAVLEVAEAFAVAASAGVRPARTVVFGFWNAEESGLFGSRHFVGHPSPPGRPVANLNLDMVGRHEDILDPSNPRFFGLPKTDARNSANVLHLIGYSHSPDVTAAVQESNARIGLNVRTSYDGGSHNLLRRSDQWSFIEHGIPALFLTTGLHQDYHTPEDDADKIDFEKLARVARLTFEAAWRIADSPAPPRFVP